MSFGSKLDDLPIVPAHGELLATLEMTPLAEDFEQEAIIFVEEAGMIRLLRIVLKSPPEEPAHDEKAS